MSELVIKDKTLYTIADKEFYDNIDKYSPNKTDFYQIVDDLSTEDTVIERYRYWWRCSQKGSRLPLQGWKIHVSATPAHAPASIDSVARVLIKHKVTFKLLADRNLFSLFNGKGFDRGSAGKFITIYPQNEYQFLTLIEELHQATLGYWGPYILSDKRYKDSKVIYYRYGGIIAVKKELDDGQVAHVIKNPDGEYVEDKRNAFYSLPEGVVDPFEEQQTEVAATEQSAHTLKNGAYTVKSVFAFSNSGGVYKAIDESTQKEVVIKEGRPYTNISNRGLDAIQLIKKEHRLMSLLSGTEVAAEPLDFFLDWEHAYLVQEYLGDGINLRSFFARIYLTLKTQPTPEEASQYWEFYFKIANLLVDRIHTLHSKNIIFGDLSAGNVMIMGDSLESLDVKLIDFESAYQRGIDLPTHIYTPGFASESYQNMNEAEFADDCYAVGALLMSGLFPMNNILSLDRAAHERYLDELEKDIGIPSDICSLIKSLMSNDATKRPSMATAKEMLERSDLKINQFKIQTENFNKNQISELIENVVKFTNSKATFERNDRLFPADPEIFEGTPLSLAYGAMGISLTMKQVTGEVSDDIIEWMKNVPHNPQNPLSVGLYDGLAGIAWGWLELEQPERAKQAIDRLLEIELPTSSFSIYNGLAGVGMTFLKFWKEFNEEKYLQAAINVGNTLLENKKVEDGHTFWISQARKSCSYAHGVSGISMFLLNLYQATNEQNYLTAGEDGLKWVISEGHYNEEGGLTWVARDTTPSYTPYWSWGSSGVGKVLLRYWEVTGKEDYAELIDAIHIDCNRKYTIFPGYFFGCSGITDFYIDLLKYERWANIADNAIQRLFSGTMLFALERSDGVAFPGESASRISCDFGTGSAGIIWMMHRYLHRTESPFMLDEYFPVNN